MLLNEVQKLNKQVQEQADQIAQLEARLAALEALSIQKN
jgi:hypothetical protein